jgi:hypothetical protein
MVAMVIALPLPATVIPLPGIPWAGPVPSEEQNNGKQAAFFNAACFLPFQRNFAILIYNTRNPYFSFCLHSSKYRLLIPDYQKLLQKMKILGYIQVFIGDVLCIQIFPDLYTIRALHRAINFHVPALTRW